MTRLASVAKAGYYPIHPTVTSAIGSYITAPDGGRIYDPCCGKGVALAQLASALQLSPYGNELQESRAQLARQTVDNMLGQHVRKQQQTRVFWSAVQQMQIAKESFNLLYLNPPYDQNDDEGRLELFFLKTVRPSLCHKGVLVWVIPQYVLSRRDIAVYLASHFHDVTIVAHPDAQRHFGEITIFGRHNHRAQMPDDETVEQYRAVGRGEAPLPTIATLADPIYTLPRLDKKEFLFRPQRLATEDIMREVAQVGVLQSAEWQRHVKPAGRSTEAFRPLTALRRGHLVNLIAAGMLNNEVLQHENGQTLFIKGQTYKKVISHTHREYDPSEEGGFTEVTTETERFETRIITIDPSGKLERRDGDALRGFLRDWIAPLTKAVTKQHDPVYKFDLNGYAKVLSTLNQNRIIPNTNGMRGLLPAQQHAVAAAATRLDSRYLNAKDAWINGMMGTGKTVMCPAVASCIRAKRVLVMCPPHLVDKWEREIKHVVPNVRVVQLHKISDVDAYFALDATVERPVYGVIKETTARSASGWEHAYQWCGSIRHKVPKKRKRLAASYGSALVRAYRETKWEADTDTIAVTIAGRERTVSTRVLLRYVRQYRPPMAATSGTPLLIDSDIPMTPERFGGKRIRVLYDSRRGKNVFEPLYQYVRRFAKGKQRPSMREALKRHDRLTTNLVRGHSAYSPLAPHKLTPAEPEGFGKWPLATYILKRYKGQIDLFACDEAHEMKGTDSDRGYAFARLVSASKKVLCLSGTFYGGKASTLFSLLYRTSRRMIEVYSHNDVARWASEYGVMQEIQRVRFDEDGRQTGNTRSNVSIKELPGASPAMMRWLLDRTVFIGLEDLGFALPEYKEEPLLLDMLPDMKAQYDTLQAVLKAELREMLLRNDRALLAAYLQSLLSWPDSPWRPKVVRHPRTDRVVASIPGLPNMPLGFAPKEAAIVSQIKREVAAGRNVLLLCQQTMTLDITPQWKQLLEGHGIKTAVLTCPPKEREAWIAKQTERGTQVIISHPRRVQTGLDLLDYPTIIWMAIDYSVYTVKQASKRSYRIGQTEAVTVQFYAYRGTLQEQALKLVAAKMAATDRIDGNTISTDSLTELDELVGGDLITTLARIVIGEDELDTPDLAESFASANGVLRDNLSYIGVEPEALVIAREPERIDVALPMEQLIIAESQSEEVAAPSIEATVVMSPPPVQAKSLLELLRG